MLDCWEPGPQYTPLLVAALAVAGPGPGPASHHWDCSYRRHEHLVMLIAHKLHAFLTIAFNAEITWTGKIQTEKIAHPAATLDFESSCKRFAILAILVSLPHLIHVSCDVLHKVPKGRLPSEGSSPKRRDNVRAEFEDVILYIACALQLFQKWFVHL